MVRALNGAMTSANAEQNIGLLLVALAECEAKRALLIGAWPQPVENQHTAPAPH